MAIFNFCKRDTKLSLLFFIFAATIANNCAATLSAIGNDSLKQTSIEIVNQLRLHHYRYISIDNDFSSKLLDKYLDRLDSTKSYLLQSDINQFEDFRYGLDNALNKGDLEPALTIFNRYQQRVAERLRWLIERLETNSPEVLDFSAQDSLETDRKKTSWAHSQMELDTLWLKRLKLSALNLKLANKEPKEISELLTKRYQNQLHRLDQTNLEDAFQLYMNVVTQSYDPHTEYFAPRRSESFNINMSLSLEGIGAVLQSDEEFTKIVRLVPGGPADLTKQLKAADRIVGVAQGQDEMVDVIGWRLDEVVDLIRGPKGTTVRLEIIPKDAENEQPKEVVIVRNKVLLEEQAAKKQILNLKSGDLTHKIGVIDIPTFYADFDAYQAGDPNYKSTTRDVKRLLKELQDEKVEGVIIDLRNNGGGALSEANALVGLFIKTGETVQVRSARGQVKVLEDSDPEIFYNGPLAVMVNRLSASASEIFAGAIQDYQRGIIIGGQTFGKGTVQTLVPLKEGQLKITQAKFYRISGESTQHQGVVPDISFPSMIDQTEIGEDALEDALPWDTIRPVLYKKTGYINELTLELKQLHTARVKQNPDYLYRLMQIERLEENRAKSQVSLNEAQRLEEEKEAKAWRLASENKRRQLKGLAPIENLEELKEEDAPVEEEDPYLAESGYILADYIKLSSRQLAHH
ncbi:MAG: carboxy terminal-processing peptidase [Pseudomonadales bacterium]|nr:carboxy terminal-processing peptidase [Pseudomonadales bacterium]